MSNTVTRTALPLLVVCLVAWAGYVVSSFVTHVSPLMVALFGGMACGAYAPLRTWVEPAARMAGKHVLRIAVAILGLRLGLADFLTLGYETLIIIAAVIVGTMLIGQALATRWKLSREFGTLISAGTAICGASAVATVAPIVQAREAEVTFSVTLVTMFGLLGVIVYPPLGHALGMSDTTFGIWAGVAIHDTAQVMAAAFSFSSAAGEVAAAAKMLRVSGLLPVTLILLAAEARRKPNTPASPRRERLRAARRAVPGFLVVFVLFVILRSVGLVPDGVAAFGLQMSEVLLVVAMAGIGMTTRLAAFRHLGWRAVAVSLITAVAAGALGYAGLALFGIV